MSKPNRENIFGGGTPAYTINMEPHGGQMEVTNAIAKAIREAKPGAEPSVFEIIGSRGWGKTLYLVTQILMPFVFSSPNGRVMWVGPHYQTALAFVEDVLKATNEETGERWVPEYDKNGNRVWEFVQATPNGPQVRFFNNCTVTVKSGDSPDSIVGRGYNLIILDEAAMIDERVFQQQIMGTARKKGIKIFIITSPRGKRHWTYRYYQMGQDSSKPMFLSFAQPWHKNPKFSPILMELMKTLPEWIRRQEYGAEFLEDGDTVFKGLSKILVGEQITFPSPEQEWDQGDITDLVLPDGQGKTRTIFAAHRQFVVGLDLAKSIDYTVFYVMCMATGQCMYYRRFNKTGYDIVLSMASLICQRFNNAELVYDATGVGSGLGDFFNGHSVSVNPFVFTNESKNELVTTLAVSIEYGNITVPNIETIVNELSVFTYGLTRTGKLSYSAPPGYHDDVVMALALANWYRKTNSMGMDVAHIDNFLAVNEPKAQDFRTWMQNDND